MNCRRTTACSLRGYPAFAPGKEAALPLLPPLTWHSEIRWNPAFLDFARYWGFTPRLCRPYRPQTKGKVEAGVKYLRRNFLCGREADSLEDLASQLRVWLSEIAKARTHGTTHRIVSEAWQEEKAHLQPIGARPP